MNPKINKSACLISIIFCLACTHKASSDKPVIDSGIDKALISFRIGDALWMSEKRYSELLAITK